jgi:PAS domain S-box-containing protein
MRHDQGQPFSVMDHSPFYPDHPAQTQNSVQPLSPALSQPSPVSLSGESPMPLESRVNILLVDDHPENLLALEAILAGLGENLVRANSGQEALRCLLHQDFAVILLDVQMPDMDGFETATLIRSRARSRQTPIIFLTAFSTSEQLMFKGYSLGAVDYLHKPIDPVVLTSKVSVFVELCKKTEAVKRQAAQLKAVNAELRHSEEQFRSLSACSPVGIFVTNTEGLCTYTNPRCQAILGLQAGAMLHLSFDAIHPGDRELIQHEWSDYLEEAWDYSAEFRVTSPEGHLRWVHVRSSPMFSDRGEALGHVGTIEDITDRKQAEAVRHQIIREQAARQEAEATNRMKDEFLAVLSHELRTPLNSMLGWARLLRTKKFDAATTERALETIERNATTQAQLIEDILDVSQIIRGKMRLSYGPANLVGVVEAALNAVRLAAEAKQLDLSFELATFGTRLGDLKAEIQNPQFNIWGDAVRLQQVVWNLLTNAIKFTPEQGKVQIRLERKHRPADQRLGKVNAEVQPPSPLQIHRSECLQVQVTDTGSGIDPTFLPQVFDRFRQADSTTTRPHNGLGLGLAIVRHIVEQHGGIIQAESPGLDQGAIFTVTLPCLHRLNTGNGTSPETRNDLNCQPQLQE